MQEQMMWLHLTQLYTYMNIGTYACTNCMSIQITYVSTLFSLAKQKVTQ